VRACRHFKKLCADSWPRSNTTARLGSMSPTIGRIAYPITSIRCLAQIVSGIMSRRWAPLFQLEQVAQSALGQEARLSNKPCCFGAICALIPFCPEFELAHVPVFWAQRPNDPWKVSFARPVVRCRPELRSLCGCRYTKRSAFEAIAYHAFGKAHRDLSADFGEF
jgi:hypothetical protein